MASLSETLDLLPQLSAKSSAAGSWLAIVRLVVLRKGSKQKEARDFTESELGDPRQVAEARPSRIAEWLEGAGLQPKPAKTLQALANWWTAHSGTPFQDRGTETVRDELRSLPGINAELADRLLLLVGDHLAFPIDRATIRITCRHGWAEPEAEYEDWQATLTRAWTTPAELQRASLGFAEIGRKYCGPQPHCAGCPLERLLPPGGPITLGADE